MALRRKSREFALQMIFQWEMRRIDPALIAKGFWRDARASKPTREFAMQLFEAAAAQAEMVDALLARHAKDWRVDRMAAIDRGILRLAVAELRTTGTPPKVVINEALEIAKKFSTEEAVPFINGILDGIRKEMDIGAKAAAAKTSASE
ncbi:MAG TPA: transcription antitermination factor NusB [Candidatus Acidoferrum sp.]|nr:transcription antitermination factor NusB [Candidatus Acidoferrum sp.]